MLLKYKNKIITSIIKNRISQINHFKKYPYDVQKEVLFDIIEKGYNSLWGEKYNFKKIASYEDYKKHVPVIKYENIENHISDLKNGKENIFSEQKTLWFSKSSGTTNSKSKYIPITKDNLHNCHFKGGKDLLSIYCNNYINSKIFEGKGVMIGGSFVEKNIGDLSAILIDNMPPWAQLHKTPNKKITLLNNFEEKIKLICEKTYNENVTNIAGVPSWMLLLLNKMVETNNSKNIKEIWPNLEVFFHGGVSFKPYKTQFQKICNNDINYLETYNASEGFFAIQDDKNSEDMLLMLDYGVFYEFIELKDFYQKNYNTITLQDVQKNKNYVLIITTNSGLYRYVIGDTIFFTSLNPFKIKISGRTKYFINTFGEEVIVDNTDKALSICCKATKSSIKEYTIAPYFMQKNKSGYHEWIIEFEEKPQDINHFTKVLDSEIKKLNSDYEAKRMNDLILKKPKIHIAPKKTFYKWLKSKNKLGGQNKVPRLSNNRKYIEEILKLF
tara:strand:- start:639 stop:2132 length:1494 start_codon:yes stop_codon:yes gene_type:complete